MGTRLAREIVHKLVYTTYKGCSVYKSHVLHVRAVCMGTKLVRENVHYLEIERFKSHIQMNMKINSVGVSSTTNPKPKGVTIPLPAQANLIPAKGRAT